MLLKCKMRAYTLLELAVVMILSGIIFAMVYQSFDFIQSTYSKFSVSTGDVVKNKSLFYWINRDSQKADFLYINGNEITCHQKSHSIVYKVNSNNIIRQQAGVQDTFRINNIVMTGYFKNKVIDPVLPTIADHIRFEGSLESENLTFSVFKSYAADELFQHKIKEEYND